MDYRKTISVKNTNYKASHVKKVFKLYADKHYNDLQVANALGAKTRKSLLDWGIKFPEFKAAMDAGKEEKRKYKVGAVEDALLNRATGFDYEVEVLDKEGEIVHLTKREHTNVTAAIFYLKNRDPSNWRDRTEVDNTVNLPDGPLVNISTSHTQVDEKTGLKTKEESTEGAN